MVVVVVMVVIVVEGVGVKGVLPTSEVGVRAG